MAIVVALIGRQNVGKSTLFNRLTHTCNALALNFPGFTRDRKYGYLRIEDQEFVCIDTGGFNGQEGIAISVHKQSILAIEESDAVLFIVDSQTGLMPEDLEIATYLRSKQKPTFVVANKTDNIFDIDYQIADFWSLGFKKIYPISASHGHGIINLLETALLPLVHPLNQHRSVCKTAEFLPKIKINGERKEEKEKNTRLNLSSIKIAIVGRPNVGKSTLINHLLNEDRMVVHDSPGTTRDSIYIPIQCNGYQYILIDTAGVRKRRKIIDLVEKLSVVQTLRSIESTNVVLLVISADEDISDQDLSLIWFILHKGRSLVIVMNKWDKLNQESKERIKKKIICRLDFIAFVRIHFVSALYGDGTENLIESIQKAYDNSTRHIGTSTLTRTIRMALENHQPPIVNGRRIKLKYAHIGGYDPPIIVVHGTQIKNLPNSYKRYLTNYCRKYLNFKGTPIRIQFKEEKSIYK